MSYNIDNWETVVLEDLTLPLSAFNDRSIERGPDDSVSIQTWEGGSIEGIATDGLLEVSKISMAGEGSGSDYRDIILPALGKSKGKLTAFLTWEGGDSFSLLEVVDGKVSDDEISPVQLIQQIKELTEELARCRSK